MVLSLVLCPRVSKELLQMFELVDDTVKFTLCNNLHCVKVNPRRSLMLADNQETIIVSG